MVDDIPWAMNIIAEQRRPDLRRDDMTLNDEVKKEEGGINAEHPAPTSLGQIKTNGLDKPPKAEELLDDAHMVSTTADVGPERIQAYAKLEFPFFNFYIQKLAVTIGRRPPESRQASMPRASSQARKDDYHQEFAEGISSHAAGQIVVKPEEDSFYESKGPELLQRCKPEVGEVRADSDNIVWPNQDSLDSQSPSKANAKHSLQSKSPTGSDAPMPIDPDYRDNHTLNGKSDTISRFPGNKVQVDVDLGPIKAVSRDHARLFFDTTASTNSRSSNGWSLEVRGRNGLVLDGKWRAKGEVARLTNRSRIQIAERIFYFVLPNGVPYPAPSSPSFDTNEYYTSAGVPGGPHEYPPTPYRSVSPSIIYGSDSDELRSDEGEKRLEEDEEDDDLDDADEDVSSSSSKREESGTPAFPYEEGSEEPLQQPVMGPDGLFIDSDTSAGMKRKRGRPPKLKTSEELAALELDKQRRSDPSFPRRPRGRPPKHKKPVTTEEAERAAGEGTEPPEPTRITKKALAEIKRLEKLKSKEEKAAMKDKEKVEREKVKARRKSQKPKVEIEKTAKTALKEGKTEAAATMDGKDSETRLISSITPAPQGVAAQSVHLANSSPAANATTSTVIAGDAKYPNQTNENLLQSRASPASVYTNEFIGKSEKPPYTYASLVAQAICTTLHKQATIQHIQAWICDNYPYFKDQAQALQVAVRRDLAVNRAFINIPLQSGSALWALQPEQAKLFDGNTFVQPVTTPFSQPNHVSPEIRLSTHPTITAPTPSNLKGSDALDDSKPSTFGSFGAVQGVSAAAAPSSSSLVQPSSVKVVSSSLSSNNASKMTILVSAPPPAYAKPKVPNAASSDPSAILDGNGFPPIAIHDNKMYLSPAIFSTLTPQQIENLQSLDTKQGLSILQAFVVNYFKVELKKKKKAEKVSVGANSITANTEGLGAKRFAEEPLENSKKVQRVR